MTHINSIGLTIGRRYADDEIVTCLSFAHALYHNSSIPCDIYKVNGTNNVVVRTKTYFIELIDRSGTTQDNFFLDLTVKIELSYENISALQLLPKEPHYQISREVMNTAEYIMRMMCILPDLNEE